MNGTTVAAVIGGIASLKRLATWAVLAVLLLSVSAPTTARGVSADETRVQAAYVMNFMRYSRWPAADREPLLIAVLGTSADAAVFRELASKAGPINGRSVTVRQLPFASIAPAYPVATRAVADATKGAHVLYVGSSHQGWAEAVARATSGRAVLTVGPGPSFVAAGGMFGMYLEGGNVRFTVNATSIRTSRVDVSARLLAIARPGGVD